MLGIKDLFKVINIATDPARIESVHAAAITTT